MIDLDKVRADTPACASLLHFNNAGAGLMPAPVLQAVQDHLTLEAQIGGYEAEAQAAPALDAFYTEFAALLNCAPNEIAHVENATRAWDMAFYGLPLQAGDRILTHGSEYVSNYLAFLQQAKRRGLHIDLIPSDGTGQIDVAAIPGLITDRTRLIAITHVPTQGGLINPAAEVGRVARAHGLIYMLDACQSAGQMPLDVAALGCDVLSGTGRKFLRGPRGTGFLYVRKGMLEQIEPAFVDLRAARWDRDNGYTLAPGARRFETWESYVAGRIGLAAAVRYARDLGLEAIGTRVQALAAELREGLSEIAGIKVHDLGAQKCGIVTFTKDGIAPVAMAAQLRAQGMNISVSGHSSARLDMGPRGLDAMARASVHYYNSEGEVARFVRAVTTL
ncbi:aminotransferase class V-fold PLP-dependent enzyme [Rhodobacteraceae bacterium KMM 6894]|nr:aminotransferase class V-fold PLP-dependent enzyme [Rhodobacteraceae bacterium KMM 6894]